VQLQWPSNRTITSLFVDTRNAVNTNTCGENGRTLGAAVIQWWNGAAWVTDGSVSGKQNDWGYTFSSPVTTTRIRLYDVYVTATNSPWNPVIYEIQVTGCL